MSAAKSFPVIGFIGLSIMGKPMALNLLRANYALVIGERRPAVSESRGKRRAMQISRCPPRSSFSNACPRLPNATAISTTVPCIRF